MTVFDRKQVASQSAFFLASALLGVVLVFYIFNIVKWFQYPDFGFSFRAATGLKIVGVLRDNGLAAGMRTGDRILTVNDQTYTTAEELRAILNWELGERNTYRMERGDRRLEINIENIPSGWKRTLTISGVPLLFGLCYIFIGTVVFLMKPHRRPSWVFYLCTAMFGLLVTYSHNLGRITPPWLENPNIIAFCFAPAFMMHLALCFPAERRILSARREIQLLPHIAALLLFLLIRQNTAVLAYAPQHWQIAAVVFMALGVLIFIGSCVQLRFTAASQMVKLRARMVLLGFAIAASVPLADLLSNAFFHVYLLPTVNYYLPFFLVFPAFVGYSIVKHNLFDIDAIIKRTYGYILTTGTVAGLYGVFVLLSNLAFYRGWEFTRSPLFTLAFLLVIVFLFNPIRNRLQRVVDRVFYRLEYDYGATVQKISERMRTLIGLKDVGRSIMDIALGTLFVDSGRVLLRNRDKSAYECLVQAGESEISGQPAADEGATEAGENGDERVPREAAGPDRPLLRPAGAAAAAELQMSPLSIDEPLVRVIAGQPKAVTIYDIQEDPVFENEREACAAVFERLSATLLVPLIYENELIGLIALGRKKSGKFYRKEDINLLTVLANQGAVAIENALMIEEVIEKERMEEELSIARDLQMSMLPAECPVVAGVDIAAASIPAREVGGDFYDFVQTEAGPVGIVIGDVTGKSVSGALVMAASRSILRMLAEEGLQVSEIMVRANRRAKKDIKKGMFVALLYAFVDPDQRTVQLCSAGQTQPVHFSAGEGRAQLVETAGDTFPLGILEKVDYRETGIALQEGDHLVFYTDGIVEAVNPTNEMFGFERLLALVEGSQAETAGELLQNILDGVREFVGSAEPHDDLTLIVLTAKGPDS